jgi:hypothetical protein
MSNGEEVNHGRGSNAATSRVNELLDPRQQQQHYAVHEC